MATSSHGLHHGGICSRLPSSESALSALSISIVTSTESESVDAVVLPSWKYAHGLAERSTLPNEAGWKSVQVGHWPQCESWSKVTRLWPARSKAGGWIGRVGVEAAVQPRALAAVWLLLG